MLLNIIEDGVAVKISNSMHLVSWIIPTAVSLFPYIDSHYGTTTPGGGWCFIVSDTNVQSGVWYWLAFYGWIWIGILFNFITGIMP
jgi:hypothetical protein